jgi:AraC-like DNA-binding protein
MKKKLPVFNIEHFARTDDFYVNTLIPHLRDHHFVKVPHKHDFYLVVLFTRGSGKHIIDFNTYSIKPGSIFMMSPGQTHHWELSPDIDGYVFFHTASFYDVGFTTEKIRNYPFFASIHHPPVLSLKTAQQKKMIALFEEMLIEYRGDEMLKYNKLHCLLNLAYIELTRHYQPAKETDSEKYLAIAQQLESLIDKHFRSVKFPYQYAEKMNLSEKHLNRVSKDCLNKTTSDLIADRIILEAKRLLVHSPDPVSEIAAELGFFNPSYFSRMFKKRTGLTPAEFRLRHR